LIQEAFDIIREDFYLFDIDGDGTISFDELSHGVKVRTKKEEEEYEV
jgi:Ca2+-binding EF-hand superfamily protein